LFVAGWRVQDTNQVQLHRIGQDGKLTMTGPARDVRIPSGILFVALPVR
jgi:hypothetical protein